MNQLTIHLRGLETLGVNAQQYVSLFTPIVMSKLPSDIRLTVARKSNGTVWALKEIIEILKAEVDAVRLLNYWKQMSTIMITESMVAKPGHLGVRILRFFSLFAI